MPELMTLPKREWATAEQAVGVLEDLLKSAKSGLIVSVAYVAERRDGDFESGSTRTENAFAVAGYLFSMGMRLMGFQGNRETRKKL